MGREGELGRMGTGSLMVTTKAGSCDGANSCVSGVIPVPVCMNRTKESERSNKQPTLLKK